jgi:hypothetical protein
MSFAYIFGRFWRKKMKTIFKFIIASCLVLLVSLPSAKTSLSQPTDYSALLGTWDIETDVDLEMKFVFSVDEDEIKGELFFEMGSGYMKEISFQDNKLTFLVTLEAEDIVLTVTGEATVIENRMTGTLSSDMGGANFEGTKRIDS